MFIVVFAKQIFIWISKYLDIKIFGYQNKFKRFLSFKLLKGRIKLQCENISLFKNKKAADPWIQRLTIQHLNIPWILSVLKPTRTQIY